MATDDNLYVVDNVHVHGGLRSSTVIWAFTAMDMQNWIPLTWLTHAANYQLFGIAPSGHHLANVFLHGLVAVLLFWMLKRATGFLGRSFMVAALFAIHPINVEAVAWVAELKTMLSSIFLILALDCYRRFAATPGLGRYFLVVAMYSLGLMAKSQIIMLPFLLLLWDYWPLQRMFAGGEEAVAGTNGLKPMPAKGFGALLIEKIPLLVVALLDAVVTLHVQRVTHPSSWPYSTPVRLANAVVAYARYLGKALWPEWLSITYPHPGNTLPAWQIAGAAALLLAITVLVVFSNRRRYLLVGWLWFVVSLVPMSGIVHFGSQAMADRYAYQPLWGIFLLICWDAAEYSTYQRVPAAVVTSACIAVLAVLTALTWRQVNYWRDDLTLWTHALQVSTDNAATEDRVAADLMQQRRTAEARQHFARASSLDPTDWYSDLELAFYQHQLGNLQLALAYYQRAVRSPHIDVGNKRQALVNMGHIYGYVGDPARARQCFDAANKLPPQ